ncbi:hypothetical protein GCM10023322_08430 [Rugosimonospora acidiphila]|uniref:Uncharacterized protein n=1 Tax=Rugosimonospora acidiphila TaxID=556531 RepID=A0ABP9RKR8_9ACTN
MGVRTGQGERGGRGGPGAVGGGQEVGGGQGQRHVPGAVQDPGGGLASNAAIPDPPDPVDRGGEVPVGRGVVKYAPVEQVGEHRQRCRTGQPGQLFDAAARRPHPVPDHPGQPPRARPLAIRSAVDPGANRIEPAQSPRLDAELGREAGQLLVDGVHDGRISGGRLRGAVGAGGGVGGDRLDGGQQIDADRAALAGPLRKELPRQPAVPRHPPAVPGPAGHPPG